MDYFDYEYRVRYSDTDKLGVSYYAPTPYDDLLVIRTSVSKIGRRDGQTCHDGFLDSCFCR